MVLALGIVLPAVQAQAPAPSPTSDGTSIDQGIAYLLMLVALVLTLWPPTSSSKPLGSSFMFVREGGRREDLFCWLCLDLDSFNGFIL
ncbi:hypothetical protein BHE74_00043247 [Ensete ventricosum]|nr:hypothetical protein BHE74_00043247 [Ensete ventricosum]RZS16022.1 hypothetical protein BHM03_00047957 [Ensete ventricosum]